VCDLFWIAMILPGAFLYVLCICAEILCVLYARLGCVMCAYVQNNNNSKVSDPLFLQVN
jgi:hypothetical protein